MQNEIVKNAESREYRVPNKIEYLLFTLNRSCVSYWAIDTQAVCMVKRQLSQATNYQKSKLLK